MQSSSYPPARIPEPSITFAVEPKTRADEDRIGIAIHKILEEDPSLRFGRDPQTKEFLLSGSGQQHVEVVVAKLRKRYHVDLVIHPPKIPYRETIRAKADAEGKHKKQTGGHGQFGLCRIKLEPLPRGKGIEFVDDVFGGAIPRNWIPSVEKGVRESAERGYLAGFPVVDFRIILYDGKYHDVDSSDMAFKIAGSLAFKEAMKQARPCLLEPIMNVEVHAPDQYSGDLLGHLSGRRGKINGSDARSGKVVIKAQVPFAEMLSYANELTSLTQGRGSYSMEHSHYDYVPSEIADKVIAAHEPHATEEEKSALRNGLGWTRNRLRHTNNGKRHAAIERNFLALELDVSARLVEGDATQSRAHLQTRESAVDGGVLACIQDQRTHTAPGPTRVHEERANFRSVFQRIEKRVLASRELVAAVQCFAFAPSAAACHVFHCAVARQHLSDEVRPVGDELCIHAVDRGERSLDLFWRIETRPEPAYGRIETSRNLGMSAGMATLRRHSLRNQRSTQRLQCDVVGLVSGTFAAMSAWNFAASSGFFNA